MRKIVNNFGKYKIISIFVFIIFLFWIRYFIGQENTIYYWGFSDYWRRYIEVNEIFRQYGLIKVLVSSFQSIGFDSYNLFSILFLSIGWILNLVSRWQYILLVSVVFGGGVWLTLYNLAKKNVSKNEWGNVLIFSLIILIILPILWKPVLQGFLDVGALIFIFVIWKKHFKDGFVNLKFKEILIKSLWLSFLVVFRRYFVYWVISYFLMSVLEEIYRNKRNIKKTFIGISKIGLTGVITFIVYFLVAYPLSLEMITNNYSVAYSAYKDSTNFLIFLKNSFSQFGWLFIMTMFWGAVRYLRGKQREIVWFSIGQTILTLYLFFGVQDLSEQHYYLIIPMILIVELLLFLNCRNEWYKLFLLVVCFLNFMVGFNFIKINRESITTSWLTEVRLIPAKRRDMTVFGEVFKTLKHIEDNDKGKIYILASSNVINEDILRGYCYLPEGDSYWNICRQILDTAEIDLRDGFPSNIVEAKYVMVAEPIQYHLRSEDQEVVGIPAKMILNNNGIGKLFYKLPYEFNLEGNVKLMIYKYNGQSEFDEMEKISKTLMEKYSGNKNIFMFDHNYGL